MFKIDLSPDEEEMFSKVQVFSADLPFEKIQVILEEQAKLFDCLKDRDAIPKHRRSWFVDANYSTNGRGISRKELFVKNGTKGRDILIHSSFNSYLIYFVCGPNLTLALMYDFKEFVDRLGSLSSGDYASIASEARRLVRAHGCSKQAPDEIFKLCLEVGIEPSHAKSIRSSIVQMK